jgi:tetratricopeptide (TPR) repeat protein
MLLGFERVLECYVGIHRQIRLHAATLEMDLTHLLAYQLKGELVKKFVDKLKKIVMDTDGSDLELKLAYVLLGIVKLFSFEGKESLAESLAYFEKVDFDLSKKFLLFEQSDTDITQSSLIEKIFGVLGVYFRGVALELQGHKEDACDQYQIIIDFLRRFKLVQFTRAKSVYDFICAAMYRCGYLLNQVGRAKESAAIFRSFLAFFQVDPLLQKSQPVNSTVRLCKALSIYLDLLDKNFRKFNFKSFCDESGQYQISSHHQNNRDSSIWQAENVQEEIILCSMLLECFGGEVDDGNDAHSQIIKRFSRIGYLEGINRIQKRNFQTHVATIQIYRNLFHAYLSSGKIEQACLAGKMYFSQENSGTDPFTLLSIAKLFLSLPSRIEDAFVILNSRLNCDQLDVGLQVPYFLLRGRYFLLKHQKEQCPFEADLQKKNINLVRSSEEFAFVLQVDDRNAEALFNLSLIHCELDDYLNFDEAEKYIKRSLSVDSSQKRAWYLFALIKSARKDFAATLNICNTELSNMVSKDLK